MERERQEKIRVVTGKKALNGQGCSSKEGGEGRREGRDLELDGGRLVRIEAPTASFGRAKHNSMRLENRRRELLNGTCI